MLRPQDLRLGRSGSITRQAFEEQPAVEPRRAAGGLRSEAIAIARCVATRLSSSEYLARAIAEAPQQSAFPNINCWVPWSVAQGYAGLALLWGYLDRCFPGEQWDVQAREHLRLAIRASEAYEQLPLGLFSGLSGLAFTAWQLSRGGARYVRLLESLDNAICPRAVAAAKNLRGRRGVSFGDFDVISGLSGVGAYLLCRRDRPAAATALASILECLVDLTASSYGLPNWYTPVHLLGDEKTARYYPFGNLNLGLAHGVPAPLALLSLAQRDGFTAPGVPEAIARVADWLCETRVDDAWGVNWTTAVPLVESNEENQQHLQPTTTAAAPDGPARCAWCYGGPGIARALWLAAEALGSQQYRRLAISAIEAVFRRPIAARRIDSPTFCHGVAGLLAITVRFSRDLGEGAFSDEIDALLRQLLDSYRPESLLGFRHLETPNSELDHPGLLEGAPGIALALLAAATNVEPSWDRLFLLS